MRRSLFLLAVISVLIFPAYATANTTCVPFEFKGVPDEIEEQWQYRGGDLTYIRTKAGTQEVLREVQYYGTESGLNLAVYKYAGELVFKAWACKTGMDPITRDKPDHMIAIRSENMWFGANTQRPVVRQEHDSAGYLTKLTFQLYDNPLVSEELVLKRVVIIPRAWFVEPQNP